MLDSMKDLSSPDLMNNPISISFCLQEGLCGSWEDLTMSNAYQEVAGTPLPAHRMFTAWV